MKEPDVIGNSTTTYFFLHSCREENIVARLDLRFVQKCYHKKKPFLKQQPRYYLFCCCLRHKREISSTPCCPLFNSRGGCLRISLVQMVTRGLMEQLHPGFLNSPISFCVCVHCVCCDCVRTRIPFHVRWRHNPATN